MKDHLEKSLFLSGKKAIFAVKLWELIDQKGTYQSDNDFLLSAVQRGNQKTFDTLFRRYYPMLCSYWLWFVELVDCRRDCRGFSFMDWENRETLVIVFSYSYLFKMVYRRALSV